MTNSGPNKFEPPRFPRSAARSRADVGAVKMHSPRLGAGRTFFQPGTENFLASRSQFAYPGAEFEDCSGGNSRPSCPSGVGGGTFLG